MKKLTQLLKKAYQPIWNIAFVLSLAIFLFVYQNCGKQGQYFKDITKEELAALGITENSTEEVANAEDSLETNNEPFNPFANPGPKPKNINTQFDPNVDLTNVTDQFDSAEPLIPNDYSGNTGNPGILGNSENTDNSENLVNSKNSESSEKTDFPLIRRCSNKGCDLFVMNREPTEDEMPAIAMIDGTIFSYELHENQIDKRELFIPDFEHSPLKKLPYDLNKVIHLKDEHCKSIASHGGHTPLNPMEKEKAEAIKKAYMDPNRRTIPVKFAISFGTPMDHVAYSAYKRSILRKDDNGESIIYIDPKHVHINQNTKYYVVDHRDARENYINGEKCFYDTVEYNRIVSDKEIREFADNSTDYVSIPNEDLKNNPSRHGRRLLYLNHWDPGYKYWKRHSISYLYHGYKYTRKKIVDGKVVDILDNRNESIKLAKRLFSPIEDFFIDSEGNERDEADFAENIQIVPIYVADLRKGFFKMGNKVEIIRSEVKSNKARGISFNASFREIFNLENIFQNKTEIIKNLSSQFEVSGIGLDDNTCFKNDYYGNDRYSKTCGSNIPTSLDKNYEFNGFEGTSQLVDNILSLGLEGVVVTTQFTPIVLDLGRPNVVTSSLKWGSYFNMANQCLVNEGTDEKTSTPLAHKTAWLGGPIKTGEALNDGHVLWRTSEDGFLVKLEKEKDEEGNEKYKTIDSSQDLFGTEMIVNGKKYEDGFATLRALTNKNCESKKIEERYVGPWDEEYHKLGVWVDKNRNGVSEQDELQGLQEAGIAAMNSCFVVKNDLPTHDAYGNETKMRAAYLRIDPKNEWPGNEEIIIMLTIGQNPLTDEPAEFRLMIDIKFVANTIDHLTNLDVKSENLQNCTLDQVGLNDEKAEETSEEGTSEEETSEEEVDEEEKDQ